MTFLNCFLIYWAISLSVMVWALYFASFRDEGNNKERDDIVNDMAAHGTLGLVVMFVVSLVFLPLLVVELFTSEEK